MFEWLTPTVAIALSVVSVVMFVGSIAVVVAVLVRLPTDYLQRPADEPLWRDHHPIIRGVLLIGKNLLGLILVPLGVIMSLPGVPGQGVLTILLGLMLLDFPGRAAWVRWLIARPFVLRAVNAVRRRYDRPPLSPT